MATQDSTCDCPVCGNGIEVRRTLSGLPSKRQPKWCSSRCYFKQREAGRGRTAPSGQRTYRDSICVHCSEPFRAYQSGDGWTMYCSKPCSGAARSVRAGGTEAQKRAIRQAVRPEVMALRRIAAHVERPRTFKVKCATCDQSLVARRNGGLHAKVCATCKAATHRRAVRVAKAKRRAVERGARADQIDPIKVFARDKWRCHLCGCRTPQKLRGTHEDRAPELDHVVTLADGGAHTWGNVACACRRCNQGKGARSLGQIGLAFAA